MPNNPAYDDAPFDDFRHRIIGKEIPPRAIFSVPSPTPKIFAHNPCGIPECDRYYSRKTPLQSCSFEKLTRASEFPTWEKRVRSAISSVPGYGDQLLNLYIPPNSIIQEHILNFLIQVVYDTAGFHILCDIESTPFNGYSTRGRDAWKSLCDHYYQAHQQRPIIVGQRFVPPPPPPAETNSQRDYGTLPLRPSQQQDQRYRQEMRDIPSRQRFGGHTPIPAASNSYRVPEPERRGNNSYKTSLPICHSIRPYPKEYDYSQYDNPVYQPLVAPPSVSMTQNSHNDSIYVSSEFFENDENYCNVNIKVALANDASPAISLEKIELGEDLRISDHLQVVIQCAVYNESACSQQKSPIIATTTLISDSEAAMASSIQRLQDASTMTEIGSESTKLCHPDGNIHSEYCS